MIQTQSDGRKKITTLKRRQKMP